MDAFLGSQETALDQAVVRFKESEVAWQVIINDSAAVGLPVALAAGPALGEDEVATVNLTTAPPAIPAHPLNPYEIKLRLTIRQRNLELFQQRLANIRARIQIEFDSTKTAGGPGLLNGAKGQQKERADSLLKQLDGWYNITVSGKSVLSVDNNTASDANSFSKDPSELDKVKAADSAARGLAWFVFMVTVADIIFTAVFYYWVLKRPDYSHAYLLSAFILDGIIGALALFDAQGIKDIGSTSEWYQVLFTLLTAAVIGIRIAIASLVAGGGSVLQTLGIAGFVGTTLNLLVTTIGITLAK